MITTKLSFAWSHMIRKIEQNFFLENDREYRADPCAVCRLASEGDLRRQPGVFLEPHHWYQLYINVIHIGCQPYFIVEGDQISAITPEELRGSFHLLVCSTWSCSIGSQPLGALGYVFFGILINSLPVSLKTSCFSHVINSPMPVITEVCYNRSRVSRTQLT